MYTLDTSEDDPTVKEMELPDDVLEILRDNICFVASLGIRLQIEGLYESDTDKFSTGTEILATLGRVGLVPKKHMKMVDDILEMYNVPSKLYDKKLAQIMNDSIRKAYELGSDNMDRIKDLVSVDDKGGDDDVSDCEGD